MPLSPDTQRQLEHYHDRITFRQEPDDLRPAPPCRLRGAQVFRQLDFRGRVAKQEEFLPALLLSKMNHYTDCLNLLVVEATATCLAKHCNSNLLRPICLME